MRLSGPVNVKHSAKLPLHLNAWFKRPRGTPRQLFTAAGQDRPVVPMKYRADAPFEVWCHFGSLARGNNLHLNLASVKVTVTLTDLQTGKQKEYMIAAEDRKQDKFGAIACKVATHRKVLQDLGCHINKNLIDATVEVSYRGKEYGAQSDNLAHCMLQKLILFIPGVCGSEISVAVTPDSVAFPAFSRNLHGEQPILRLECDSGGRPTDRSRVVKLDLLRKFIIAVYEVEHQRAVHSPPGHVKLQMHRQGRQVPVHHYHVQPWPYDWRLRLEESASVLTGGGSSGESSVPPYAKPPSLKQIIDEARGTESNPGRMPFLADKIAVACHSTGGLILRKVLKHPGIEATIDRAFFVDIPFWGAPKAYYIYLSGDMFWSGIGKVIRPALMQQIAPNLPIVYYLAPTEQYPDTVANIQTKTTNNLVMRDSVRDELHRRTSGQGQLVGREFMNTLIELARRKNDYPAEGQIPVWNETLEADARAFHDSIQGEPVIGWNKCIVFWSNSQNDNTPGAVIVKAHWHALSSVDKDNIVGDGTVPLVSQQADVPQSSLKEIQSHPEHVPSPNASEVWEHIVDSIHESLMAVEAH